MAFSDAFARGYEIGDAAKKRRAASKYFERFKELTDEGDAEEVTAIGGVPIPKDSMSGEGDAALSLQSAGGESALPVEQAAASAADAPLLSDETAAAIPAPEIAAPTKIPLKQASEVRKSFTQANIKELDKLAMDAARAAGDIEVYTALQKTTDSFLHGKVMKNLGLAQTAAQNGETDQVEKYLTAAYRFIPDGQEIKFSRKDGKLMTKDPWDDGDIEMNSEMIGNIATMLSDPQKWAEIARQERKDRAKAKTEEREVAVKEGGLEVDRERLGQFARSLGIQEGELALKNSQHNLEKLMAPIERMNKYQQGMYYGALAEQAKAAAKEGKTPEFLDEARQISESIESSMDGMTKPPENKITGQPDANWKPSREVMVAGPNGQQRMLAPDEMSQAKGLAQTIAIENRGTIGHQVAQAAGLQLIKAQVDPDNFNAQIDASTGVMLVPFRGMNVPIKLPAALVQSLVAGQQGAAAAQQQQGASPFGPPGQFLEQ